ncbi:MAG: thioredoxin domain-containing protein [Alphaproteobacteria bacterium]|nr:thioredoxin domain-containing protein [Alphaproteobacteria bacterium]
MRHLFTFLIIFLFASPLFALEVTELKTKLSTDRVLGKESAKVTLIEYASLSCSHCAKFHAETMPSIQKDYIDTGKVRFIYRDFPLDAKALIAAKLAHCAAKQSGDEKYFAAVKLLFEKQKEWTAAEDLNDALFGYSSNLGLDRKALETCFADKDLDKKIAASRLDGTKMGVSSTPSFFVNGEAAEEFHTPVEAAKTIDAVLAGKSLDQERKETAAKALKVQPTDLVLGKENAKVTVIEYLNVGCPHCGSLHKSLLSSLQKEYIDTGKVRLVFRELPMASSAFHAYLLAHCKGKEHFFDMLNVLIENNAWSATHAFMGPLRAAAEAAGITKDAFYTCMENKGVEARITENVAMAQQTLKINHSPTIFVNGEQLGHVDNAQDVISWIDAALRK